MLLSLKALCAREIMELLMSKNGWQDFSTQASRSFNSVFSECLYNICFFDFILRFYICLLLLTPLSSFSFNPIKRIIIIIVEFQGDEKCQLYKYRSNRIMFSFFLWRTNYLRFCGSLNILYQGGVGMTGPYPMLIFDPQKDTSTSRSSFYQFPPSYCS